MLKNIFRKKTKPLYDETFSQSSIDQTDEITNNHTNKLSKRKKIFIALTSLFMIFVISFCAFAFALFYVKKDYEVVSSFTNMPEPIQTETTGGLTKQIDDYNITINFKAKYTIVGKVVEKRYYPPFKMINKLSNYDIGIAWGALSDNTYDEYISYKNNGNRFLSYRYNMSLANTLGGESAVKDIISNNHIIHADDTVLKCLRNIKEGQHIKIEGYLSYVSYESEYYYGDWNSSLTRTDHGDGACEIIYVTKITWLKTN